MNSPEPLHDWLAEEIRALFQGGEVGLWEFTDTLNSDFSPPGAAALTPEQKRSVANKALAQLLKEGHRRLRWRLWAVDYDKAAGPEDVTDDSWKSPPEDPYLAIEEVFEASQGAH